MYQSPVSALPLLYDPPFTVWMLALGLALGYRLLRVLRVPLGDATPLERAVLSACVGLGVQQYVAFGLGIAGALRPAAIWAALIIETVALGPDIVRIARAAARSLATRWRHRPSTAVCLLVAAVVLALVPMYLQAMAPCTDPDGLSHRLTPAKRWLQQGNLDHLPTITMSLWPMGGDMLYVIGLGIWSDTAAKTMHFLFGALMLLGAFALGRRLAGETVGAAAMALCVLRLKTPPDLLGMFGSAYMDLAVGAAVTASLLSWAIWRDTRHNGWLAVVGLLTGFAATYKLLMLSLGPTLALLVLIDLRRRREPCLGRAAQVLLLSALVPMPWLVRTWSITGNPLYPMLSGVFPSRWWSHETGSLFGGYMRYYNWSPTRSWSLATRKIILLASTASIVGLGALMTWRWQNRRGAALAAVITVVAAGAVWTTGPYFRYLAPIAPTAVVLALVWLAEQRRVARFIPQAAIAIVALTIAVSLPSAAREGRTSFAVTAGLMSRDAYLDSKITNMAVWRYANANLPQDARIALVGPTQQFYSDRPCYIADPAMQNEIRLSSWEDFVADLRRLRIQYALVSDGLYIPPWAGSGNHYTNRIDFARRIAASCTRLTGAGLDTLYRLDGISGTRTR